MAILMCCFLILPANAEESVIAESDPIQENESQAVLLSSEDVLIKGTEVIVDHYYDQGFLVETYRFPDHSVTESQIVEAIDILDSRSGDVTNPEPTIRPMLGNPIQNGSKKYSSSAKSSSNICFEVSQSGTFYTGSADSYMYIWIKNAVTKAGYTHPDDTPDKITIHQTITTTGLCVSWSYPPAISSTTKTDTYILGPYEKVNFVKAEWIDAGASSRFGSGFSMTVTSRADAYFGGTSYAAYTSDTGYYYNGF